MRPAKVLGKTTSVASIAVVAGLVLRRTGLWSRGAPLPVTAANGRAVSGSLSVKTNVDINGVRQGMFIQSADVTNPVLLYLHGGMPEFFFTEYYPTGLERVFTVAWWDRRGAGLSYDPRTSPHGITLQQHLADTLAVTDYLRERFGQEKVYLMAHSGGTFFGLQAAARAPDRWRPSAVPGRAASASTGGFRHRTSGVGIGAVRIASTSSSARVWSASIFRNTSPTRRVARSAWATTTSISSTSSLS